MTCEDGGHEAETCRNDNVALTKAVGPESDIDFFVKDVVAEEKYRAV